MNKQQGRMLFNSLEFLIFFPVVFILYYWIKPVWRWALLLAASYVFYMFWKVEYTFLIIISTLIDYISAIKIDESNQKKIKTRFLLLSLFVNLGLLFGFKYLGLFTELTNNLLNLFHGGYHFSAIQIILPVGISFYTFQTMSYTIDVYKGKTKPERHLGKFALFVSFFPQLVAGPIERSGNLLPQINKISKYEFDYDRITSGLKLMLWGFFKKIVIADRIAFIVGTIYSNPEGYQGWPLIITSYLFFFQVYCDFSGYSDIAIGAARIFGIRLMTNFDRPYAAKSFHEFWKRWHISLTTWFRDYVYIPLGGNRKKTTRVYINIFIVFLVSGLWHGASITFILWGAFLGLTQIIEYFIHSNKKNKNHTKSGAFISFIHIIIILSLISFSMVFFGAGNSANLKSMIENIFAFNNHNTLYFVCEIEFIMSVLFIIVMITIETYHVKHSLTQKIKKLPLAMRMSIYATGILIILLFGIYTQNDFIYFQF